MGAGMTVQLVKCLLETWGQAQLPAAWGLQVQLRTCLKTECGKWLRKTSNIGFWPPFAYTHTHMNTQRHIQRMLQDMVSLVLATKRVTPESFSQPYFENTHPSSNAYVLLWILYNISTSHKFFDKKMKRAKIRPIRKTISLSTSCDGFWISPVSSCSSQEEEGEEEGEDKEETEEEEWKRQEQNIWTLWLLMTYSICL